SGGLHLKTSSTPSACRIDPSTSSPATPTASSTSCQVPSCAATPNSPASRFPAKIPTWPTNAANCNRASYPATGKTSSTSSLVHGCVHPRAKNSCASAQPKSRSAASGTSAPAMAAYRMMREIMENLPGMRGIYILGKAATLNGSIGDVMISNVVLDEHSQNTYWLDNCFTAQDVQPYLIYGSVLDNQKAVSAKGTYLQNRQYLDFYYRANYTVVEMESGPYLNAVYED